MDKNTMVVAVCGMAMIVILITVLLESIVRVKGRRMVGAPPKDDLRRIETRLADMQEALDTVAVEVERISEGQRFTTKLLADRGEIPLDAANGARAGRAGPSR
jgi:hypothetical protein